MLADEAVSETTQHQNAQHNKKGTEVPFLNGVPEACLTFSWFRTGSAWH
jgi:hypothetical protein